MLKKVILFLFSLAFFVFLGSPSWATMITFTDTTVFTSTGTTPSGDLDDYGRGNVNRLDGIGDYVAWTHHFTYDFPVDTVLSGTLSLDLRDDGGWLDSYEVAFGYAESGDWDIGDVDTGSYSYNVGISSLADGSFSVTLASVWGDFYIDNSDLTISYEPVAAEPVPEPGTIILMGVGLLGVAVASRKRFQKKDDL
ncbi:putative exosortase, PEP-CTERM type [Desulfosarcina variabilis str. Montpellier]|uniref:PEP-CTERM sorting domain-containing protein n=1 Tax=Desulfosarcina variabilis TaxID=2300 RepID=UPI003AFAFAB8